MARPSSVRVGLVERRPAARLRLRMVEADLEIALEDPRSARACRTRRAASAPALAEIAEKGEARRKSALPRVAARVFFEWPGRRSANGWVLSLEGPWLPNIGAGCSLGAGLNGASRPLTSDCGSRP